MIRPLVAALAVLAGIATAVHSQEYPSRLIKMVHGFPPGGNVDIIARILAHQLQSSVGQSVVVEGKPGVAGSLAAESVTRADADGHTLLFLTSIHPMQGGLSKNVKYDVVNDFTWISTLSFYPFLICVRKDSPIQTLKQLIDEAKAKPEVIKYGSAGVGTGTHTIVELLANQTQSRFLHVPYRGESAIITALLTGEVDFVLVTPGAIAARIRAGEFRALAVTSKTRWQEFADVPTADEAGVAGFESTGWTGLAGPPHLPAPVVSRLNSEVRKAITDPQVKARLEAMGGDPRAIAPEVMQALVAGQYEIWKKLATSANLTIN